MKKTVSLILAILLATTICIGDIAGVVRIVHADQAYKVSRMVAEEPDDPDPTLEPEPTEEPPMPTLIPDPTDPPAPEPTQPPAPEPTLGPDPTEPPEPVPQPTPMPTPVPTITPTPTPDPAPIPDPNYSLVASTATGVVSSISFGTAPEGFERDYIPLTISNMGSGPVDLIYTKTNDADGAFGLSLHGDRTHLEPGQSTLFNVSMDDNLGVGTYNAVLRFADGNTDPNYQRALSVPVSGGVSKNVPVVTNIDITPSNITLAVGAQAQFKATVTSNIDQIFTVKWGIAGNRSTGTIISDGGLLTIADDETSSAITVIATTVEDPSARATAAVSLQKNSYNVNVYADPSNGGQVSGGGAVSAGGSVTLSAAPNRNFYFDGWVIDGQSVSKSSNLKLTNVQRNYDVYAKFVQNTVRINAQVNNSNAGTVDGGGTFPYGGSTTLTARAYSGYVFKGWKENDTIISTSSSISLDNMTVDRTITAIFDQTSHTLTLVAYPPEGGKVQGGGTFDQYTSTTIKATPTQGWHFEGWQVNNQYVSRSPEFRIDKVSQDYTCTAVFVKNTGVMFEVSSGIATTGGSIAPSGKMNVLAGQNITYTITPKAGYAILAVAVDGVQVGPVSQYTFTNVQGPHTIAAAFVLTDAGKAASEASGKTTPTKKVEPVKKTDENTATKDSTVNIDEAANGEGGDNYVEEMDLSNIRIPSDEELGVKAQPDAGEVTDSDVTKMLGKTMTEVNDMIASGDTTPILDAAFYTGHLGAYVVNSMEPSTMNAFDTSKLSQEELMMASDDNINPSLPDLDVVVQKLLTTDEVSKLAKGEYVDISVSLTGEAQDDVDHAAAKIMKGAVGKKPVKYFDLTMLKTVDGNTQKVTELPSSMEVVIEIPDDVYEAGKTYSILRVHNGQLTVLPDLDDDPKTITFRTDRFSSYAIAKEVSTANGIIAWLAGGAILAFGIALTCLIILIAHHRNMRRSKRAAK